MRTQEAMCLNLVKQNLPGLCQSRTVAVETFVTSRTFSQFFSIVDGNMHFDKHRVSHEWSMKMISIKVKEARFQVFYWLHTSIFCDDGENES